MSITDEVNTQTENSQAVHFGHLGIILAAVVLLMGLTWMEKPQLFSFNKTPALADLQDVPHYYAYVPPADDVQPQVLGASTVPQGPSIINEDGSVTSAVDVGQVLAASTADVVLPLDQIPVVAVPDSPAAIQKYITDSQSVESGYISNADFETALSSGNQQLIDKQSQKLLGIKSNLQKLPVPEILVQLQKLKLAQYSAAINILNNFTKADQNPEMVGQYLDQFLKAQQDQDTEQTAAELAVKQKYNIDLGYPDTNLDLAATAASSLPTDNAQ